MFKHYYYDTEVSWGYPSTEIENNEIIKEIVPWENGLIYCQNKVYFQLLDSVFVQVQGQEPQQLLTIPNLSIKSKQDATFHLGCINNDILMISDAAYFFNENSPRRVSIYHDMKEIQNLHTYQIFEFCGINVLYNRHDGILYKLSDDLTAEDDRPYNQCYLLNLLTMQEKKLVRPHIDKWGPTCLHKIIFFGKTGFKPTKDALEGMFDKELEEYNQQLETTWDNHIVQQTPQRTSVSSYSSLEKDIVSCFTIIGEHS